VPLSRRLVPRLLRTTSFRLTLVYAGLVGLLVVILFGVIYWTTASFMASQFDAAIADELDEVLGDAGNGGTGRLRSVVDNRIAHENTGMFYLLEDPRGTVISGNLSATRSVAGLGKGRSAVSDTEADENSHPIRGHGVTLADGGYLFVGADSTQLRSMQEIVAYSFLAGLVATVAITVAAGAVMSLGLLRRIEAISRTSHDIMQGDLSRRVPLRGTGDEFDQLATGLNAMLDRIETLMEGLSEVSSDIAHDLRTPLSRLRQRLELAGRRGRTVEELRTAFHGSVADVDAILDTFGALLRITQIEAGSRKAGFVDLDLADLLLTMLEVYLPVAEEKRQHLSGRIASALRIRGDRELLTQMLANLVENAIRHAPEGAQIRLAGECRDGVIVAEIADNGPGIPAEMRGKVFQRFYRLEASRRTPGSGLGLSLVAAICRLHDVAIELADNEPGLRVVLHFPVPG
jgi:signal transduction histidine kinase